MKPLPDDTTETCDYVPSQGWWSRNRAAKGRCGKPARFISEMTCGCGVYDMTHRMCEACHLKVQAQDPLPDRNDATLDLVRELGFDTDGTFEKVFFLGPSLMAGRETGAHATEAAILEFVAYFENQIAVAKDYLANGRNNKTHEWPIREKQRRKADLPTHFCRSPRVAVCGAPLDADNFAAFYDQTTNAFAHITCVPCQDALTPEFEYKGFDLPWKGKDANDS